MAAFLLLMFLLSGAASDTKNVTATPGEDVPLPCQGPRGADIPGIVWSRPDLGSQKYVFFFRGNRTHEKYQLPSYRGRVTLRDPEMKNGNVSVVVKNVSVNDTGTYQCRVIITVGEESKLYSTTQLTVSVPEEIVVTVRLGDDVILPCQAADPSISVVEWRRPDLEPNLVLLYIDGGLDPTHQHPSYKDRVELVDRDLKDGDVSLILKNVSRDDNGTYECGVKPDDSRRKKRGIINSEPISIIRIICLQVTEPDIIVVPVHRGQDVILPCQAADPSIRYVEWTRPDLETKLVLLYSDGRLDPTHQHPSFKDRVELVDRDLKDGDASLILKNVSSIDNGTYECRVESDSSRQKNRDIESVGVRIIRSVCLQVSEPADVIVVPVHPGDDVTLPCHADSSIRAVEWSRPDLEPDYVLLYRDGNLDPAHQHPSYTDRVDLVDRELKDGDASLILKNVSRHDKGTYECRVESDDSRQKKRGIIDSEPISTIRLQVTEPASPVGLYVGLAAGGLVLVAVAAVVGVWMCKRHLKKRSRPPDEASAICSPDNSIVTYRAVNTSCDVNSQHHGSL